jgi:hypothetical protein
LTTQSLQYSSFRASGDFHSGVVWVSVFLVYDAVSLGNRFPKFDNWIIKVKALCCLETSGTVYPLTPHPNLEKRSAKYSFHLQVLLTFAEFIFKYVDCVSLR